MSDEVGFGDCFLMAVERRFLLGEICYGVFFVFCLHMTFLLVFVRFCLKSRFFYKFCRFKTKIDIDA